MKSILIIGMGDFGQHLCKKMTALHNDVMIIDKSENLIQDLEEVTDNRIIADCTSRSAVEALGVSNFDVCFVCIGSDFKSNLIIVTHLRELGAKRIVTTTDDEMLEKLLLSNGADDVIYPNKDSAERAAVQYSNENILEYRPLEDGYAVYEIPPISEWVGKSILESNIRAEYGIYIIGIHTGDGETRMMPSSATIIRANDKLTVMAHESDVERILRG